MIPFVRKHSSVLSICGVGLLFALLPLVVKEGYLLNILVMIVLFAYLSQCWDIVGGFAGQLSFGHAAFFGIGPYVSILLNMHFKVWPWGGMVAGGLLAVAVAWLFAYPTFRYGLRGSYFALGTLALSALLTISASNVAFLGGAQGLLVPYYEQSFRYMQFGQKTYYYYLILAFMVLLLFFVNGIRKSRFGYYLSAIREDEDAAESLGVKTRKVKMVAMLISAFLTALGGTLYAQYMSFIDPEILSVPFSIEIILPAIIGGGATLFGPLLGAVVLISIKEGIRLYVGHAYTGLSMVVYGLILIGVIIMSRKGLVPLLSRVFFAKFKGEND
jgi:branched-chain amino acid transport system permease protein